MNASAGTRLAGALRWGGWGVALCGTFLRALVGIEPLPYWDTDPTRAVQALTGLTPAWSQGVDVCIMVGAALALLGEAAARRRVSLVWTVLVLVGTASVWLHGAWVPGFTLEDARVGSTWIAAMAAGLAGMHLCRDERARRVTIAGATGLLMLLAAKGVLQVAVEHQQTLAQYRADPEAFLASQGWIKGSISARNFERRLMQPEATGWFGLANVYATFAAAGLVGLTGWTLLAWRQARDKARPLADGWAGVLSLGAIAAAVALWLAGSKGGTTAAGIGLALLAGRMLLVRRGSVLAGLSERAGGMLAVALVLSAIGAVVVRGVIGTRMGELSLLFRWFYMEGATRIFAARPGVGVGPAGFKDAYMLFKPALSPEEVQSPHSVMFDFAATLGVLGLAWVGVWLAWVFALGRRLVAQDAATEPGGPARPEGWFVALTAVVPVIVAIWLERAVATPDAALARVVGLLAWVGVGCALLSLARLTAAWRWVAALGALVVAVHGQIEVTPVWGGSACLVMVTLAAAGARTGSPEGRGWAPGASVLALAAAWAIAVLPPTVRWERALERAAEGVRPYATLATRLQVLQDPRTRHVDSMGEVARDLGRLLGAPAATEDVGLGRQMDRLLAACSGAAAGELSLAMAAAPRHLPTVEAYCRMRLTEGVSLMRLGDEGGMRALEEAQAAAQKQSKWPSAGAFGLLANVWSARAEALRQPELMNQAIEAWRQAAAHDPWGLTFPLRAFRAELALGHAEAARRWAGRVLELDKFQRLDELKRLTPQERAEVEGALSLP